jgi:methyl-accepting chemotaxis protein
MNPEQKRKNYFIDKKFQGRFMLKFCSLIILGGILTIVILYLMAYNATAVSIINSRVVVRSTADFILPILIQTVAIVVILVGIFAIILTMKFSHKVAGPLYRFKKVIADLGKGDFSQNFQIRRLDQLQDLANYLNEMITKTRLELKTLKENFTLLKDRLEKISDEDIQQNKNSYLKELKNTSLELDKIIKGFKI